MDLFNMFRGSLEHLTSKSKALSLLYLPGCL